MCLEWYVSWGPSWIRVVTVIPEAKRWKIPSELEHVVVGDSPVWIPSEGGHYDSHHHPAIVESPKRIEQVQFTDFIWFYDINDINGGFPSHGGFLPQIMQVSGPF